MTNTITISNKEKIDLTKVNGDKLTTLIARRIKWLEATAKATNSFEEHKTVNLIKSTLENLLKEAGNQNAPVSEQEWEKQMDNHKKNLFEKHGNRV